MNAREKEAIRQAKILRHQPDPTGLADEVSRIPVSSKSSTAAKDGQNTWNTTRPAK